jgi:glycerol-3-phosphate acyltransferase PlsY
MENLEVYKNTGIIIFCYFLGGIPFCYIIVKIFGKKDLSKIGDKSPSASNVVCNVSKFLGIVGGLLDFTKGYVSYFFALKITGLEIIAILAGCAAIAGHNYSPYLKFSGGKGFGATFGVLTAIYPFTLIVYAVGLVLALLLIRNRLWGFISGFICSGIFLCILKDSMLYLALVILIIIIVIPKDINYQESLLANFKFHKEKNLKNLFTAFPRR